MIDFITIPEKTEAHSEMTLLEEISKFITVINKQKDISGVLWPYYRILNPTDGDLNIANFPNLGVCSIEYQHYASDRKRNKLKLNCEPNKHLASFKNFSYLKELLCIFSLNCCAHFFL